MKNVTLRIKCRIEELPVLGAFLLSSMEEGLGDFMGFWPGYDAVFLAESYAELAVVEGLVNPKLLTAELKVITARLHQQRALLTDFIYLLEGYIRRAEGLSIGRRDFGIGEVRVKNHRKDVEGLIAALVYLEANVRKNMAALAVKGYTAALHLELTDFISKFRVDNVAQNDKLNERNNCVAGNNVVLNSFWDRMLDISDAGKRIYRTLAPNRVEDFSIMKLKDRIRREK